MSIGTLGLREQKKRETRRAISDHATQLFLERGFDRTTIADIAAAARVAKMTVTNYFPRKEDLALDQHEAFVAGLAQAVAHRRAGESALAAVRRAFMEALERRDPVIGFTGRDLARMVADSPTLVARLRDLHDQREESLAARLTTESIPPRTHPRETSSNPDAPNSSDPTAQGIPQDRDPTARSASQDRDSTAQDGEIVARAVAAQLAAADRLLFRDLRSRTLAGQRDDDIAAALAGAARQVFALLEPAIGDYAIR
ncbi:TetR family transcriptional regulator [Nonomuraea sp. K274]|uniref:TetR family transcriptional regulator n=1 Tax=Nonomuraea cypriaca TaxID=1187855 RepID=A0A931AKF3_9ACTN|nr:TetR family transcriptional regulator [Nonomuraea cypriaca]MBF8193365.1 TetR family transcriptional regulator [Nonomuraea cypriaca]